MSTIQSSAVGLYELARSGEKIAAIKALRAQTTLSLKEAKDVIDLALEQDFTANGQLAIANALKDNQPEDVPTLDYFWVDIEVERVTVQTATVRLLVPKEGPLNSVDGVNALAVVQADASGAWTPLKTIVRRTGYDRLEPAVQVRVPL